MMDPALAQAIKEVGGKAALAKALGISYQAIDQWHRVPALRVLDVEAATHGKVSRYELRPNIYGPAPAGKAPHSPASNLAEAAQ